MNLQHYVKARPRPGARPAATLGRVLVASVMVACGPLAHGVPHGGRPAPPAPRVRAPAPPAAFEVVATGGHHACGITRAGRLFCWGADDAGQLGTDAPGRCGVGPDYACSHVPLAVAPELIFRDVATALDHTCALTLDGRAYCWGAGFAGQLGDGSTAARTQPAPVAGNLRFRGLSALGQHTCALADSGAYCWGLDADGEAGNPAAVGSCRLGGLAFGCALSPARVAAAEHWVQVVAGGSHSCGLTQAGEALCWGSNRSGQLGAVAPAICPDLPAPHPCATRPVPVAGSTPRVRFRALVAGAAHTCGLTRDGRAYCWGRNDMGQLGTGSTVQRDVPVLVAGGVRFTALIAGGFHTCGLSRAGRLYCWGQNAYGQLGATSRRRCAGVPCATGPVRVPIEPVSTATAGFFGTCVLTAVRRLCWGRNDSGQLGVRGDDVGAATRRPRESAERY